MAQWFFSYNGQQMGPLDDAAARAQARSNPNGHCWRQGFSDWQPIAQVAELQSGPLAGAAPPPVPGGSGTADEIDYKIFGSDMQFVEIELDPGEGAVAEDGEGAGGATGAMAAAGAGVCSLILGPRLTSAAQTTGRACPRRRGSPGSHRARRGSAGCR